MNAKSTKQEMQEAVRRLRSVTRRVEAFLAAQQKRLSTCAEELGEIQSEYDAAKRLSAELDQARQEWRREKQAELNSLEQANHDLASSWQDLEQQKRELEIRLNQGKATQSPLSVTTPSTPCGLDSMAMSSHAQPAPGQQKKASARPDAREMATLQRQIQQHQKRRR